LRMVIGVMEVDLLIDGAFSLKEKRMTLNRVRDRVRKQFNVSIAEVADQDVWNRACIAVVAVSNDQRHVNSTLSHVIEFIKKIRDCEVEDFSTEFM